MPSQADPGTAQLAGSHGLPRVVGPHPDASARTAPGRKAFLDRFEKQVDPDGELPPPSGPGERNTPARRTSPAWLSSRLGPAEPVLEPDKISTRRVVDGHP